MHRREPLIGAKSLGDTSIPAVQGLGHVDTGKRSCISPSDLEPSQLTHAGCQSRYFYYCRLRGHPLAADPGRIDPLFNMLAGEKLDALTVAM